MSIEETNVEIVKQYLRAVESGATGESLAGYFTEDFVQHEFPNPIVPKGARRGLKELKEAAERGQKVVSSQRYEVRNIVASGDQVVVEILWSATLKVAFGTIPVGGEMRAHIAMVVEMRDGKVAAQRNYDCYEPW
jgi:ketosteroid isomerase-like protein